MINFDCYRDKNLTFFMKGEAFNYGFDLYQTVDTLQNLQNIFDKAYLTISNKSKMTEKDRAIYKVKATEIRQGSFIADLTIYVCDAVQLVMPILAHYSPTFLWDVTKEGFKYLKTVLQANKSGKTVSISNEGNDTLIINISGNNNCSIAIDRNSHYFASKSFEYFQNIARKVDGKEVEAIEVIDYQNQDDSIILTKNEKEIFTLETRQEEVPIKLRGVIFRVDTHKFSGKMVITQCDDFSLKAKEINYELQFFDDIGKCCAAIDTEAEFVAYKRISFDPIKLVDEVKSLKIISINLLNNR